MDVIKCWMVNLHPGARTRPTIGWTLAPHATPIRGWAECFRSQERHSPCFWITKVQWHPERGDSKLLLHKRRPVAIYQMVSNICYFLPYLGKWFNLMSISLFKWVETLPPTSYTWFYPGGFLLKSLHLSLVQRIRDKADVPLFSSSGKSGWNLSPFGFFSGLMTAILLEFTQVQQSLLKLCNGGCGLVMSCFPFKTGKGFAQLSEARIKRISPWQKRARGTWVKRGCLQVFWSWESIRVPPPMPPSQEIRPC